MTNPPDALVEQPLLDPRCNLGGEWRVYGEAKPNGPWDVGFDTGENGYVCIATVFNVHDAKLVAAAPKLARTTTEDAKLIADLRDAIELAMRELADRDAYFQRRVEKALVILAKAGLQSLGEGGGQSDNPTIGDAARDQDR